VKDVKVTRLTQTVRQTITNAAIIAKKFENRIKTHRDTPKLELRTFTHF
jgi:hypothetical protein